MNSHPSALRDFTVDRRVWLLSAVAIVIGAGGAILAVLLLRCIALATNIFYFHRFSLASVSPAASPLGHWMPLVPRRRRPDRRRHGALRLRQDPRPRHPRGHRVHPPQRRAHPAQNRHPQAHLRRHLHRLRRPLRRRRPHHHDRRSIRLPHRPVDAPHRRRAHHPPRRRSLRRHVRHLRLAACRHPPRRRATPLRVASPQPHPGRLRQHHGCHPARPLARLRPALHHARSALPANRLGSHHRARPRPHHRPHSLRSKPNHVRLRRPLRPSPHSLDVVACPRRRRHRHRRHLLPPRPRRRLRQHRRPPPRQRPSRPAPRSHPRQVPHVGLLSRLRDLRRSPRPAL